MLSRSLIAQEQPELPDIEIEEPARPIADWLVETFDADPDAFWIQWVEKIVEPLFMIVVIVVIAAVASKILLWALHRGMRRVKATAATNGDESQPVPIVDRSAKRLDALGAVLDSTVRVIVWTLAFFAVLHYAFGVTIGPLLAGFGVIGFAIGFGAQDLVKDFISGFFMLIEDQFGVGDYIDAGDASGWVEDFSLRTTTIRDFHGTLWHIPNGEIRRVGNKSQEWSRALLDIGVAYGADIDQAATIIKATADELAAEEGYEKGFLDEPELWGVESLDDSAVVIRLAVKTTPGDQWSIARELRRRIKLALDAADVEIPFPQRAIWLRYDDEAGAPVEVRDAPEGVYTSPEFDGDGNGDGE